MFTTLHAVVCLALVSHTSHTGDIILEYTRQHVTSRSRLERTASTRVSGRLRTTKKLL